MSTIFALPSARLEVGSLKLDVFSHLLFAIFRGELPPGTRLKIQHLSARFGVSSTPIREAVVELAGLGVVELAPNRGAVVAPFGATQVREIYLVRRLLEVESIRRACAAADLQEIEQVADETTKLLSASRSEDWLGECVSNDRAAHRAISHAAGVMRLQVEMARYDRLMHVIRLLVKDVSETPEGILQEHHEFLQALLRRDADAAGMAMANHMNLACERAVSGLFRHR